HEYVVVAAADATAFQRFRLTKEDLERLGAEISDACFRGEQPKNPLSSMRVPAGVRSLRGGDFTIPKGTIDFGVAKLTFEDAAVFRDGKLTAAVSLTAAWTMKDQC